MSILPLCIAFGIFGAFAAKGIDAWLRGYQ